MTQYIGDIAAGTVAIKGIKIGEVKNSTSSKGAWSVLYYYKNRIISIIYSYIGSSLISDGLVVDESEIKLHTDNIEQTLILLKEAK